MCYLAQVILGSFNYWRANQILTQQRWDKKEDPQWFWFIVSEAVNCNHTFLSVYLKYVSHSPSNNPNWHNNNPLALNQSQQ